MTLDKGHEVRVKLDKTGTQIWIDGKLVQNVVSVEIRHHVEEVAQVTLTFHPAELKIMGTAELMQNYQDFATRSPGKTQRCVCGHLKIGHLEGWGICGIHEHGKQCKCKRYREPDV